MLKRKEVNHNNEISQLCTFSLGGYQQKVLIEGKSKDNPIVIALHGGPGSPIPFSVGCRGLFPMLTDAFLMVYWDQLGCGINNHVIDDSFTIELFVQMTAELTEQLKAKFPNNKIMIFSTSWGSVLSAKLLEKNPHAVDGVIAYGQIVKSVFFCNEVTDTLARSSIPEKKLEKIKNMTADNFTRKDLQLLSTALLKYTDAYQNRSGSKFPMGTVIKGLLTSPDYSLKDFKAILVNGYAKNTSLWKEITQIDLSDQLRNVDIPYLIFQGDTDIVASTKSVKELVSGSNNAKLSCRILKNTGHIPGVEMVDTLLAALQEVSQLL